MLHNMYYLVKPFISRTNQVRLRRMLVALKINRYRKVWPIDYKASLKPKWFKGWPEGKKFTLLITHDVEQLEGLRKTPKLLSLDKKYSLRSSFGFVPKRYPMDPTVLELLRKNGCEIYVHDLYHDGMLFSNYKIFHERAQEINQYITDWSASGFRAGAMHRNLDWIGELNIKYDMSTFDTDPFEPMPDGAGTIFPFVAASKSTNRCYVEIPYTLPQDLMTLVIQPKPSIDVWIQKLKWVAEKNGMASFNVHPDYMAFDGEKISVDKYSAVQYEKFLAYINNHYRGEFWNPLPKELATFVYDATRGIMTKGLL